MIHFFIFDTFFYMNNDYWQTETNKYNSVPYTDLRVPPHDRVEEAAQGVP